jgi:hypothetical protein
MKQLDQKKKKKKKLTSKNSTFGHAEEDDREEKRHHKSQVKNSTFSHVFYLLLSLTFPSLLLEAPLMAVRLHRALLLFIIEILEKTKGIILN